MMKRYRCIMGFPKKRINDMGVLRPSECEVRTSCRKKKREKQLIVICDQYLSNRIPCNYYRVLSRASKYKPRYESRAFLFTARSKYHRPQTPPSKQMQHRALMILRLPISIVIPTAHRDGKRSLFQSINGLR